MVKVRVPFESLADALVSMLSLSSAYGGFSNKARLFKCVSNLSSLAYQVNRNRFLKRIAKARHVLRSPCPTRRIKAVSSYSEYLNSKEL